MDSDDRNERSNEMHDLSQEIMDSNESNKSLATEKNHIPITKLSEGEFVAVFQMAGKTVEAVTDAIKSASATQAQGFETFSKAVDPKSETLEEIAKRLETDEARLEFAKIYIEIEREKTKRAESAEKMNESNNGVVALAVIGVLGFVGLLTKLALG